MRGLPFDIERGARPTCYSCYRPVGHCLCQRIRSFEAHYNILILQHPNERSKYNSTAKLVTRAIPNSRIMRGLIFDPQQLEQALAGQKPYLLYPDKNAQDCDDLPLDQSNTVIVLDGTWGEARKILRRNPLLRQLPCVSFKAPLRSNFHIRKQPKPHCLSTIESLAHMLKLSAAASGQQARCADYDHLLWVFEQMVEQQLNYFPRRRTPPQESCSLLKA